MHLLLSSSPNWYLSHVVAATRDGSVAAYAGHLSVTVLCCQQQQILRCLWPQRIRVSCVTFAADDAVLIAGYEDGSARCFNWQTGECTCSRAAAKSKRKQSTSELTAVVAPPWLDAAAVFGDAGGRLLLWPCTGARSTKYSVLVESCGSKVVCLTAAPGTDTPQQHHKQVIAGCLDGSCVLVDVSAGCQLARWKAHNSAVHSVTWTDTPHSSAALQQQLPVHNTPAQPDEQQHQQQQGSNQGLADQPGTNSTNSSSSSMGGGGETVPQGVAEPQFLGLLVSAGADRRVKLWQVPCLATPPHLLPQTATQEAAAAGTAPAAEGAAVAEAKAEAEGSAARVDTSLTPAAASGSGPDVTVAPAAATATTAASAADSVEADPNMQQGQTPSPRNSKADTAAAATHQLPVVLQLQPVSAAAVDPSPPTIGPKSQQFYGTAALVPGSADADGSCVVVCAGVNGRVGVAKLLPGKLDCHWSLINKSPHTGGIFQLLLLQQQGTSRQPQDLQHQQQQQQQQSHQTGSSDQQAQEEEQQQQQQEQLPRLQASSHAGGLRLLSVSMDRSFAASTLLSHASPLPPPPPSTSAAGAQALSSSSENTSELSNVRPNLTQIPGSGSSSSSVAVPLQVQGCTSLWVCQGLGAFAYSCIAQHSTPDAVERYPGYSKVRVAVGCGDKTIRVVTLGVRQAAAGAQQQQQQQQALPSSMAATSEAQAAGAAAVPAAVEAEASAASSAQGSAQAVDPIQDAYPSSSQPTRLEESHQTGGHSSSSSSSSDSGGLRAAAGGVCAEGVCELQLPVPKPTLLWKNIQDRAQAVAWHPTNPRLLAFGCYDGSLGVYDVCSTQVVLYSRRHGGPVTHLAWWHQPQQQQPQGQQKQGTTVSLLSLGGEGCVLSWPAISPGSNSPRAQPVDMGQQLQQTLAAAAAAGAGQGAGPQQGSMPGHSHMHAGLPKPGREFVHWSCMALSACGSKLAVCSTRGQVLMLRCGDGAAAGAGGGSSRGSGANSWRSGQAAGTAIVMGCWQLEGCGSTPAGLPVKAAAWQPGNMSPPSCKADPGVCSDTGTRSDLGAGSSATCSFGGAAGGSGRELLLAAIDEQHLYVLHSSPPQQRQEQQGVVDVAVASCSVAEAQRGQQQLLTVAWVSADTICVGCSDGSIQVVKVAVGAQGRPVTQPHSPQASPAAAAAGVSPALSNILLQPLHSLRGHTGAVLCLSSLPGWAGLLLSGSQDQTLRSWQPLLEAAVAPAALQSAAAAAVSEQQEAAAAAVSTAGVLAEAAGSSTVEAADGALAGTAALAADAGDRLAVSETGSSAGSQKLAEVQQQTSQAAQEPKGVSTPMPAAGKASKKASRLFICPKAKSFLPELPDRCDSVVQQQTLLDVVALAEALYTPCRAASSPAAAKASSSAAALGPCDQGFAGLDREVLALLGVRVASNPAPSSSSAQSSDQQLQRQQGASEETLAATDAAQAATTPEQQQQQQQQQYHPAGDSGIRGVTEAFHQQLAGVVGPDYPVGSWLPTMTADVPELLLQHQQWTEQQHQQQRQQGPAQPGRHVGSSKLPAADKPSMSNGINIAGGLTASQLGMLRFITGDVRGFLKEAVVAGSMTPDVVALSAAGGVPAFSAAAALAAVKLAADGDREAAAVHLLAAGDAPAAASMLK